MEFTTQSAQNFALRYYVCLENGRDKLPEFYRPSSLISWNGRPMQSADLLSMIANFPPTKTKVDDYDCQSIMGSIANLLLMVSGSIRFADKKAHIFSYE
ncbi:mRNA export receptor Nxt1 [Schizosaccharomyces octosporus yFS286]|uniref:mRNA export receptor Nxt1 n=1 Tax=Schizosaccharomyces octosporus (strain yFS286) TaxID=483514 RepID=S9Q2P8_SCHOY|nr:mRNA export receptor Nxt1 [Schizosaccharomyces octosporus yFS286]EPX73973.1 mRNA export receptor Nxt1 [Schizosaccharomyces octosporus yFS286]